MCIYMYIYINNVCSIMFFLKLGGTPPRIKSHNLTLNPVNLVKPTRIHPRNQPFGDGSRRVPEFMQCPK